MHTWVLQVTLLWNCLWTESCHNTQLFNLTINTLPWLCPSSLASPKHRVLYLVRGHSFPMNDFTFFESLLYYFSNCSLLTVEWLPLKSFYYRSLIIYHSLVLSKHAPTCGQLSFHSCLRGLLDHFSLADKLDWAFCNLRLDPRSVASGRESATHLAH